MTQDKTQHEAMQNATHSGTYSVSELAEFLSGGLREIFPDGLWVSGEIANISRSRGGHVYFNLIEPSDAAGHPLASLSVVLFKAAKEQVNRLIKEQGDPGRMQDGVEVRIQGTIDFYAPSGSLQLKMTTIDPTYTLGRLADKRDQVVRRLQAEGLLRANAARFLAPLPLRIGLVTSLGSAAHADVKKVFQQSRYSFTLVEVDAATQGQTALPDVVAAIATAARSSELVLVVRGGGSRTDLAAFDQEGIARAIATCRRPVFTGIGHEIDHSVADDVAHTAHPTPTAAAAAAVELVQAWLDRLDERGATLTERSKGTLQGAGHRVELLEQALTDRGRGSIVRASRAIDSARRQLQRCGLQADQQARERARRGADRLEVLSRHGLRDAERRLQAGAGRVRALDPALALQRGWTITRRADGTVLRSVSDAAPGDSIITRLFDGTLASTVTNVGSDPLADGNLTSSNLADGNLTGGNTATLPEPAPGPTSGE